MIKELQAKISRQNVEKEELEKLQKVKIWELSTFYENQLNEAKETHNKVTICWMGFGSDWDIGFGPIENDSSLNIKRFKGESSEWNWEIKAK